MHAFEDVRVIAGQGTIGLELAEQLPDVGTFVIPVGGGGLAAGIVAGAAGRCGRACGLVGVQAQAGGTRSPTGSLVKHPRRADDADPRRDARRSRSRRRRRDQRGARPTARAAKLVVEGAGAAALAALLAGRAGGDGPVAAILSRRQHRPHAAHLGDAARTDPQPAAISSSGRSSPTGPGELTKLLERSRSCAGTSSRSSTIGKACSIDVTQTEVELTLVTRDEAHCGEIVAALAEHGYRVERLSPYVLDSRDAGLPALRQGEPGRRSFLPAVRRVARRGRAPRRAEDVNPVFLTGRRGFVDLAARTHRASKGPCRGSLTVPPARAGGARGRPARLYVLAWLYRRRRFRLRRGVLTGSQPSSPLVEIRAADAMNTVALTKSTLHRPDGLEALEAGLAFALDVSASVGGTRVHQPRLDHDHHLVRRRAP